MTLKTEQTVERSKGGRPGSPPIPKEHGAWVILYSPLLIGFAASGTIAPRGWHLLVLAITGAFLAREAVELLLRKRSKPGTMIWLVFYVTLLLFGALPLLAIRPKAPLLFLGALGILLFCLHSALLKRGRLDRSQWGEMLGVAALTLTGPAAYAVSSCGLDRRAWLIWLACITYYCSGVFRVKMLLVAAKAKRDWSEAKRKDTARDVVVYHILLTLALIIISCRVGRIRSFWLIAAYLPVILRASLGQAKLSPNLPPLKRLGVQETILAIWFTACLCTELRIG